MIGEARIAGTTLAYEIHGAGTTLLLLHGFTLDRRMWRRQVEGLARHFRVVTWDARGFGRSAAQTGEPFRHADDAAALCEHLGLGPVVAVGHSIGAHQMLELALSRPDLVCGYASIAMAGLASVPFTDDLMALFGEVRTLARTRGVDAAKERWLRGGWFAPARERPELRAEIDAIVADYSGWSWLNDAKPMPLVPTAAERLAEVTVPKLVVSCAHDLPYNAAIAAKLAAGWPDAVVVELPVGHMPTFEAPDAVTAALAALAERCG